MIDKHHIISTETASGDMVENHVTTPAGAQKALSAGENTPPACGEKSRGGVGVAAPAPSTGVAIYSDEVLKKKSNAYGVDKINAGGGVQEIPEYDKEGRMKFHPAYHPDHRSAWSNSDEKYLIENYEISGPEMTAAALGRTVGTVMTRAYELRRDGKMPKRRVGTKSHKRARHEC